nr:MAG TPA: hypothetical protein [Caudoviricetes sp.]
MFSSNFIIFHIPFTFYLLFVFLYTLIIYFYM